MDLGEAIGTVAWQSSVSVLEFLSRQVSVALLRSIPRLKNPNSVRYPSKEELELPDEGCSNFDIQRTDSSGIPGYYTYKSTKMEMEYSAAKKIHNFLEIALNTSPNVRVTKKINGDLIVKYNKRFMVISSFTEESLTELKGFIVGD